MGINNQMCHVTNGGAGEVTCSANVFLLVNCMIALLNLYEYKTTWFHSTPCSMIEFFYVEIRFSVNINKANEPLHLINSMPDSTILSRDACICLPHTDSSIGIAQKIRSDEGLQP